MIDKAMKPCRPLLYIMNGSYIAKLHSYPTTVPISLTASSRPFSVWIFSEIDSAFLFLTGYVLFISSIAAMMVCSLATRMREAGADIKATADIMGHHEVGITLNTYTDASEKFKMKEISLLETGGGNLAV